MPTDFSALRAPEILKTFEIRPVRATFSCFYGSQSHPIACEHALDDLLTLASCYYHSIFWGCPQLEDGERRMDIRHSQPTLFCPFRPHFQTLFFRSLRILTLSLHKYPYTNLQTILPLIAFCFWLCYNVPAYRIVIFLSYYFFILPIISSRQRSP